MTPAALASSFKQKLKSSLSLSCCLHNNFRPRPLHHDEEILTPDIKPTARLVRTSSSHHHHHDFPELKDKCKNFISRVSGGGNRPRHIRRHSSADFRYDALSYALNFDESSDDRQFDEYPLRNFASRLPPSPNRDFRACAS
ncbi:Interleukin-2 receptor subunit beta like [Melia azedarach]|uniref:Interleukin-2 receptor subunit beta like n=1 Tax=Melia azedarach TaxID=155640 RepID=A0ACC1XE70_MELAZ|nr:Interleukin-2 receptor subunit beta like [Melia azedarach]